MLRAGVFIPKRNASVQATQVTVFFPPVVEVEFGWHMVNTNLRPNTDTSDVLQILMVKLNV